jgi:Cysteine dioxygenase type I
MKVASAPAVHSRLSRHYVLPKGFEAAEASGAFLSWENGAAMETPQSPQAQSSGPVERLARLPVEAGEKEDDEPEDVIQSIEQLAAELDLAFERHGSDKAAQHAKIMKILPRVDLHTSEINKYTFWDAEKPYTRNLIASDGINYSLLLLCWGAGKESKIHDHPCDNCE